MIHSYGVQQSRRFGRVMAEPPLCLLDVPARQELIMAVHGAKQHSDIPQKFWDMLAEAERAAKKAGE